MVTTGREHNTHSTFSTTSVHTRSMPREKALLGSNNERNISPLLFRRQRIRQPGIFRQPQPLSPHRGIHPAGSDDLRQPLLGQGEGRLQGVHQSLAPQGKAARTVRNSISLEHTSTGEALRLRQWTPAEVTLGAGRKQVLETVNSSSGWV